MFVKSLHGLGIIKGRGAITQQIAAFTKNLYVSYCTILFAQYELAKASGLALNTKPMLKI